MRVQVTPPVLKINFRKYNMQYTIDYFIKKFKKIPANKFCMGSFSKNGRHCMEGWCRNDVATHYSESTDESRALDDMCFKYLGWLPVNINDGACPDYKQRTIKERIMAALKDIKRLTKK